jgi:hypothetical protein
MLIKKQRTEAREAERNFWKQRQKTNSSALTTKRLHVERWRSKARPEHP